MNQSHGIILFDGRCNLCNGFVQFILKRDRSGYFKFAPLHSDAANRLLEQFPAIEAKKFDSVVLIENDKLYFKADAALRILAKLDAPWNWLRIGVVFPKFLRDGVYDLISRYRYKWFGKRDECMLPDPAYADRFID